MAARHVGRRIGTVSSQHRAAERRRRSTPAAPHRVQRGKRETLTPGERRHLIQLVACGSIFVLLVAVKLLLPGRIDIAAAVLVVQVLMKDMFISLIPRLDGRNIITCIRCL